MNFGLYLWFMLRASLFSTGGFGNVPLLHESFIPRGWATEQQFAEAMAVGQISPGPNGLWVISFGYLTYGWRGAICALIAVTLPPFVILGVERLYRHIHQHPAVEGFMRGLGLAVIGIFTVVLTQLMRKTGVNLPACAILLGSVGLGLNKRVPLIAIFGFAALAGIVLY